MAKITRGQIALIHVAKKQTGMCDDDYRALLLSCTRGQASSAAELDNFGFTIVMKRFERLGFRSTSPRRPLGIRASMASDPELALCRRLWLEFTGVTGTEAQLGVWLDKKFKVSALRFLPAEDAGRIICALRAMCAHRRAKEAERAPPAA
jgi:hypothetical protein